MSRSLVVPGIITLSATLLAIGCAAPNRPAYPETRTVDVVETLHGVQIADPYRWLEADDDPEVQAWIEQQNALTRSYLDAFPKTRAALAERVAKAIRKDYRSSPTIRGDRQFLTKQTADQDHGVLYVRNGDDGELRVLIDVNELSKIEPTALDWWAATEDGAKLVYGLSKSGSEYSTLYVMDVETGQNIDVSIPNCRHASIAWDLDGGGFHYTRYPEAGTVPDGDERYYRRVYYHKLGTDWHDDPLVFGEGLAREATCGLDNYSDRKHQHIGWARDWTQESFLIGRAGDKDFKWAAVGLPYNFHSDVYDGKLICRTNWKAPRYRIMVGDPDNPSHENWTELIPEQKGVLRDFAVLGGKLVVHILEDVHSRLVIYNLDGSVYREVELPCLGSVGGFNGDADQPVFYFSFSSFTYPPTTFRYDLRNDAMDVYWRQETDVDPDAYVVKQIWFESTGGVQVPMFVMYKKGLKLDGQRPTILDAYGGFNIAITPGFSATRAIWLDHGGVYAIANIRGGGEFGAAWHEAGRRQNKQNCFDDFFAAAEKLIADGYTNPSRLAASGGSNGGLLMGAAITQRPDLFAAVSCGVPLLDMLRFHLHEIAGIYTPEYGDPDVPEEFQWLLAYSPYHHVENGVKYPSVLFTTAEKDSRVDPMHACKTAARMQALTGSNNPILLWVEPKSGHGSGLSRTRRIDKSVDYWIYMMWRLGVLDEEPQEN